MWADGRTDMKALRREMEGNMVDFSGIEPREPKLEGFDGRVYGDDGDDGVTVPFLHRGDNIVVLFGSRIDRDVHDGLARLAASWDLRRAEAEKWLQGRRDLFLARLDLAQISALIDDDLADPRENKFVRQLFGLALLLAMGVLYRRRHNWLRGCCCRQR